MCSWVPQAKISGIWKVLFQSYCDVDVTNRLPQLLLNNEATSIEADPINLNKHFIETTLWKCSHFVWHYTLLVGNSPWPVFSSMLYHLPVWVIWKLSQSDWPCLSNKISKKIDWKSTFPIALFQNLHNDILHWFKTRSYLASFQKKLWQQSLY